MERYRVSVWSAGCSTFAWVFSRISSRPEQIELSKRIAGDRPIVSLITPATAASRAYKKLQWDLARFTWWDSLGKGLLARLRLVEETFTFIFSEAHRLLQWSLLLRFSNRLAQREVVWEFSERSQSIENLNGFFSRKQSPPLNPRQLGGTYLKWFHWNLKTKKREETINLKKSFKTLRIRKKLENLIKFSWYWGRLWFVFFVWPLDRDQQARNPEFE